MMIDPPSVGIGVEVAPHVETIVVRAARLAPSPSDKVFSITRLSAEDLGAAPRLDEALKQVPGASLFRRTSSLSANPTSQGLSLRAIAPSGAGRALVTLDGVPQNDPFGGWVIWSSLPPEGLSGVSVVRGAGAGAYGAGALTGVVALDEAASSDWRMDLSAGELGSARLGLALGQGPLSLVASRETSRGYVPVRGSNAGAADARTNLDAWSVATRLQAELGPVVAALRVGAYQEDRGAGLVGANSRAEGQQASLTLAQTSDTDASGWRAQAWVRRSNLANSSVAVASGRASQTPANNQYATPATGYGLNGAWRWAGLGWTSEIGADGRLTDGEEHELFRYMGGVFTRDRRAGGKTSVIGAYWEGSRQAGPWLLAGGARLDAWAARDGFRRETNILTNASTLDAASSNSHGLEPTARLGLRRDLGDAVFVRSALYSGFRTPTLNELHRPFRVGNDITEANPNLKPERLIGLDLAFGGEGVWRWSAGAFVNRLQDPITNVTLGAGPGINPLLPVAGFIPAGGVLRQRQNAGRIEAYGLEAEAGRDLSANLKAHVAVSATHARVKGGDTAPQLNGKRPAQTPELTVVGSVSWAPIEPLSMSADLRLESARFEDDLNTRRLAPSASLDARIGLKLGKGTEVYLAADNLTDATIAVAQSADGTTGYGAPRLVRVGISLRR